MKKLRSFVVNIRKKLSSFAIVTCIAVSFILLSCESKPVPKPKAYPKVIFPESYSSLKYDSDNCPFTFKYPEYANIQRDSLFFKERIENPCWLNIEFDNFNSTLHLTYKEIADEKSLNKFIQDSRKLTYKHTKKADFIDETPFRNEQGASGIVYEVGGDAASSYQFFITDQENHFVRGSLYFKNVPNSDSLKPVIGFIKQDISELISTFAWK